MMMQWKITLREGQQFLGAEPWKPGRILVNADIPEGHFESVSARVNLPTADDIRIFMNGYQSWTWCPEYGKTDRIRGLTHLPKFLVNRYSLDRYADYHFFPYPYRRGYTHGYSYCYFRKDGQYMLIGSLDEKPGYTMFMYNANREILTIRRDCEGVASGGPFHAFDLFFAEGTEDEVFDAYFEALGITARHKEKIAGYSSWYNRYQDISELTILEDLRGAKEVLTKGDLFQIDDGWEPYIGDWLRADPKKFPNEMKDVADEIHAAGFRAGIWLAPFVAEEKSETFRLHPDWFLKEDGKPWKAGSNWSGFYALDFDHPEVRSYLKEVFDQILHVWEYDLVKLDFLYAAAPFGTASESRAARMIRAVDYLRSLCGDKLILGCGVPLFPAFGKVDYCRVSCDVSLDWDDKPLMRIIHRERVSTKHAIETDTVRHPLDGRAFGNDPDVFFLRSQNTDLSEEQKRLLAENCAQHGSVLFTSDNMTDYDSKEKAEYRRIRTIFENRA